MTVRDLILKLIEESPDLDADVYIEKQIDAFECQSYEIKEISNEGANDAIFIKIKGWHP